MVTTTTSAATRHLSLEYVSCCLCGQDDTRVLLRARDTLLGGSDTFTIVQCKRCGLAYVSPRPTRESMASYYPETYFDAVSSRIVPSPLMRLILYPFGPLGRQVERLPAGRLLDVGCGEGRTLEFFRQRGWETYGVDPSAVAIERAKSQGLRVFQGEVTDHHFPDSHFDLIIMRGVVGNMHDPVANLREVGRVLKVGGKVFLTAAAPSSPILGLLGQFTLYVDAPRHLYLFTSETLCDLLCRTGFRVIKVASVPFLGALSEAAMRRACGRLRRFLLREPVARTLWLATLPVSWLLAVLGINRGVIELVAEKDVNGDPKTWRGWGGASPSGSEEGSIRENQ